MPSFLSVWLGRIGREFPLLLGGLAAVVLVLSMPMSGYATNIVMQATTYAVAVLGLTIVLGYAGQITLAQAAFFGIGAYAVAIGTVTLGLSFWGGLLLAMAASTVAGAVLGITSLRLGGHYLAMITIVFQQILSLVLTNWIEVSHGPDGIPGIPRPSLFGYTLSGSAGYLVFSIVCLTAVLIFVRLLKHTRLGRAMEAVRDNELAASVAGVNTYRVKVVAFTLSALLGGIGGALFASGFSYVSPDQFSLAESIVFLTMALLGGAGSALGTAVGTVLLVLLPESLRFLKEIYMAVYGVSVILIMIFMPDGIAGFARHLTRRLRTPTIRSHHAPALHLHTVTSDHRDEPLLVVRGLAKHFGGLRALNNVDLAVRRNNIHALIGPNGSGKTTLVNVLSGIYKPTAGKIAFADEDVTGAAPHVLAGLGLSRTFQNIRLFRSMSCLENVMVGAQRPGNDLSDDHRDLVARSLAALHFVGMGDRADDSVANLSYGHQRMVEIARALAANPKLLLLDEPAAGLNLTEKQELVALLLRMKGLGLTILIIEHDMPLVEQVADSITVLNFGERISDGQPEAVLRDPAVISAYLGEGRAYAVA